MGKNGGGGRTGGQKGGKTHPFVVERTPLPLAFAVGALWLYVTVTAFPRGSVDTGTCVDSDAALVSVVGARQRRRRSSASSALVSVVGAYDAVVMSLVGSEGALIVVAEAVVVLLVPEVFETPDGPVGLGEAPRTSGAREGRCRCRIP
ncbi:hypothetical protein B0H17DRAFT_1214402 [Mycena rosella]|uniref:Uncharacterized protein n=1 Tax=Mycena rosella TaxID=1033263 RepID=A0AAD7CNU7_MYCRO|nr:hypothetical protein B0H17DRAFT_1214402 [Mycena rosella]